MIRHDETVRTGLSEAVPDQALRAARILIVDDEEANVRLLERLLRQAGYADLRSTTESREVVAVCMDYQPDLILLDLRMPYRDGFAVLGDLRLLIPKESYVPVLVLTADVTTDALRRALLAGAKDFLTKPFDAHEVLLRIRNLLETRFLHCALEQQNLALEERVRERTQQLLQAEKLSAMGQLLAGVAHELNNPLSVVLGQASLLRETGEGGPARAEKIAKAADRCVRIVKNFLALAREHPPERSVVSFNTVVRDAVELLAYELRTGGVEVQLDLAEPLPSLWADPHQLHQVLVNILANAQQAMQKQRTPRRLTVTTGFDPGTRQVRLAVADSGPGIPAEIQSRIFEPFFTTKPVGQGTGLGLALSHSIISEHEGSIRVESEPGQGATFFIELPIMTGDRRQAEAQEAEGPQLPVSPKRVLVVDDEEDVAGVLVDVLRLEGHEVDTANNGAEGLQKLDERAYDLVLSDTKMPVMDGPTFYGEFERRHPDMLRRIVFVSGDMLSPDKREFLERTGAPVVAKPFEPEQIRRVVRRVFLGA